MPDKNLPTEVSEDGSFTLQQRQGDRNQASVTSVVTSTGKSLGQGGELFGIAKGDLTRLDQETHEYSLRATMQTLTPLHSGWEDLPLEKQVHSSNLITRAVASSRVDDLLGMNCLSHEKFGMNGDEVVGISVGVDGVPSVGKLPNDQPYYLDIDYSDPEIQKGLSDLEALDYITGQVDRHTGNIFIDPETRQVRGIDNDLAFPSQSRETILSSKIPDDRSKLVAGLPQYLHEDTARKIEHLRPEELRRTLMDVSHPGRQGAGRLDKYEIEGAVHRLEQLQREIVTMRKEGRVVQQFDNNTYQAMTNRQSEQLQKEFEVQLSGYQNKEANREHALNTTLSSVTKTSYLGTIQCGKQLAISGNSVALTPESFSINGVNPKISRDPFQGEYDRLQRAIRKEYETSLQGKYKMEMGQLTKKIGEYEERLEKLNHKDLSNTILFKGTRESMLEKGKIELVDKMVSKRHEMGEVDKKIRQDVEKRMEYMDRTIWDKAVENVELRAMHHPLPPVELQENHLPIEMEVPDLQPIQRGAIDLVEHPMEDIGGIHEIPEYPEVRVLQGQEELGDIEELREHVLAPGGLLIEEQFHEIVENDINYLHGGLGNLNLRENRPLERNPSVGDFLNRERQNGHNSPRRQQLQGSDSNTVGSVVGQDGEDVQKAENNKAGKLRMSKN